MGEAASSRSTLAISNGSPTLACTPDGIFLWPGTALLVKLGGRFIVRPRDRIYDAVCRLHGPRAAWTPLLPSLERAAELLNEGRLHEAKACLDRLVLPPLSRAATDLAAAITERLGIALPEVSIARDDNGRLRPDLAKALVVSYDGLERGLWPLVKAAAADGFDDTHPRLGGPPNPGWFVTTTRSGGARAPSRSTPASRRARLDRYLKNPNVRAFLDTIAEAEGGKYNNLYGGKTFDSYASFPGATEHSPAGRYQITRTTYSAVSQALGLTDFSRRTQDYIAAQLLLDSKAMDPLVAGNIDGAITAAARQWNAFALGPGEANRKGGQPYVRFERVKEMYERRRRAYGGQ